MLNCSVAIPEMTGVSPVSAEQENEETSMGLHINQQVNTSTVDKLCGIASKDHGLGSLLKEDRSEVEPRGTLDAEFDAGSAAWESKLVEFVRVAEARRELLLWQALRISRNREAAEDIVQEALLKGFKNLSKFRGDSMMGTWLVAIVTNVGREWLRSQKERTFQPLGRFGDGDEAPFLDGLPAPCEDPEQLCARWEISKVLLSEINQLDSVCKHALRMCAIEERSHLEAAHALGVSVNAVKSRLFHGKRMLKRAVHLRAAFEGDIKRRRSVTGLEDRNIAWTNGQT